MGLPANVRVNAQLPFPSLVTGTGPITIGKVNGIWQIGFTITGFGQQTPPPANYATDYVLIYDTVAKAFFNVSLANLVQNILSPIGTMRMPVSAANIAILAADIEVGIDTRTTAVTATLPSATAWATANPNGLELTLVDIRGNAAANNITPSLNGGDIFYYGGVVPKIVTKFGLLKLRPAGSPVNGWYVRGLN